jgi:hypothetical protein
MHLQYESVRKVRSHLPRCSIPTHPCHGVCHNLFSEGDAS